MIWKKMRRKLMRGMGCEADEDAGCESAYRE